MGQIFSSVHISWYQKRDHSSFLPSGDTPNIPSLISTLGILVFLGGPLNPKSREHNPLQTQTQNSSETSAESKWALALAALPNLIDSTILASISRQMHLGLCIPWGKTQSRIQGAQCFPPSPFIPVPCAQWAQLRDPATMLVTFRQTPALGIQFQRDSSRLIVLFSIPSWPWIPNPGGTMFLYGSLKLYWIQGGWLHSKPII